MIGCQSTAHNPPSTTRIQPHLGTLVSITVHNQNNAKMQSAINAAFDEFRAMDKLRQAFGRKHAVETMESKHKADAKAHRNKMLFDRLMNLD